FEELHETSAAQAGVLEGKAMEWQVMARGVEVGTLTGHHTPEQNEEELIELVDYVLPTIWMSVDNAISFTEVLQFKRTLEDKVVERTAQLAEANEQLVEAKAARDRFFANINHEIRTPLTLIQLASDAIMRSGEALSGNTRRNLDEINASTRRLLHLVNSLLLLAAGDEGKLRVRPGPCDVATCLRRLTRNWVTAAQKGDLEITFVGPDECAATIDEAALETIVGNFISNAVKFSPPGGRITVSLSAKEHAVTVNVRDTGPGIEPEFIPKLFGRFERAATAVGRGVRGTGIGLALSKELVELQHGTIRVDRHDDPSGTSFEVTLPRFQTGSAILPQEEPLQRPSALEEDPTARNVRAASRETAEPREPEATIVLAEDDLGLAQHITDLLSGRYRVLAATNGKAALALAKEHIPDLLVTDLEMPEMNGLDLTREFLALQGTALSPVLIVSAHAGLGERLAGFEAGAVDYVLKPFSAEELLARIRSQLAIRKMALKLHESEKLAALGMLSAGLAHELRNPANALVNALQPMMANLPELQKGSNTAEAMLAEIAVDAANQIRERCSRILDFSRSEQVVRRPEDVRALIARARRVLTTQLANVEIREQIELDEPLYCAGPLIEQIVINLLDNAAFAAGPQGWVQLSVRSEGALAVIEVGDSGPGVPPQLLERIFDPFFTTKPVGKGTGLGLTISRRIAKNHGGDLRVVRQGNGSMFRLELPRGA
ncbi:MAG TPA: ATP-binding protein, partial [Kofleriaceae bacterium]|nr:ATP-binding protein [Kofleriaceae bacterium]